MEYRNLGTSGLKVSALSYGSWVTFGPQMNTSVAAECMHLAYDAGCNFFDNAEVYADGVAEEIMGAVLAETGWDRSSYIVSTKIFWGGDGPNQRGLSRKHILEGTDASLKRLGLDYVDLIFCHRADLHTPVEETVRAMVAGVRARFGVETAVAVSGVAGPDGGTADKPVGTVWLCAACGERVLAVQLGLPGDRNEIRTRAAQAALDLVRRVLRGPEGVG